VKPIVFVGPSLFGVAKNVEQFDFAPPAACGDIYKAVRRGRKRIGLIDGIFETGPAVWHKEILFALSQGCQVLGSSSMGALRAAECHHFGMQGIGNIFEDYASARRTSDADVALLYGPAETDFLPLSVPQVDVEATIGDILSNGLILQQMASEIVTASRAIFYKERTWPKIIECLSDPPAKEIEWSAYLANHFISQKKEDALLLLRTINQGHFPTQNSKLEFISTLHFEMFKKEYE
jgi:hypothetical protein